MQDLSDMDCKDLIRRDMSAFILRYDRFSQDKKTRKVMCENIGRIIQSKEISKLDFKKIVELLNDEQTEILNDDLRILAAYIKDRYPNKIQEIFKTEAVKKLEKCFKDRHEILGDEYQIEANSSQELDIFMKMAQQTISPLLNIAFRYGNLKMFNDAIEQGFDSTMKFKGYEPVDFEIVKCTDKKAYEFFSSLKVFSQGTVDDDGNTLLMAAIINRFPIEFIEKIIREKPQMNVQNKKLENVFHIAASCRNNDYISYLMNTEVDILYFLNQQDIEGNTPIHIAAKHNLSNMKNLIVEGINLEIRNNNLDTALHIVINTHSNDETAEQSIDAMKDIKKFSPVGYSTGDRDGNTPLHIAIKKKYQRYIEFISNQCPEVLEIKNKDSFTPIDICAQSDDPIIFEALIPNGKKLPWIQLTKRVSINIIEKNKKMINFEDTDEKGNTIFHLALIDSSCNAIAKIYFDFLNLEKKFDVLQKTNNAGEVPTLFVKSDLNSTIYNNIFNCPGVTAEQKLECELKNNDKSSIKRIFDMKKSEERTRLLTVLVKYCTPDEWEEFPKEDEECENFKKYLISSIKSPNSRMSYYFIKKMENALKPLSIIMETNPISIECLRYIKEIYKDFQNTLDDYAIAAVKANCPEAAAFLIPDNFDVEKVADIVTNTSYQMMSVVFEKNLDKITNDTFFSAVNYKNMKTVKYCIEKNADMFCNAVDSYNNTALNRLFIEWCQNGSGKQDLIEVLIKSGSKIDDVPVYEVNYNSINENEALSPKEFDSIGKYLIEKDNHDALKLLCDLGLTKTKEMLKLLIERNGNEEIIIQFIDSLFVTPSNIKDINSFIYHSAFNNLKTITQKLINIALIHEGIIDEEKLKLYLKLSNCLDEGHNPQDILESIQKKEPNTTQLEKEPTPVEELTIIEEQPKAIEDKNEVLLNLTKENSQLKCQIEEMNKKNTALQNNLDEQTKALELSNAEIQNLTSEMNQKQAKIDELSRENKELEEKWIACQKQVQTEQPQCLLPMVEPEIAPEEEKTVVIKIGEIAAGFIHSWFFNILYIIIAIIILSLLIIARFYIYDEKLPQNDVSIQEQHTNNSLSLFNESMQGQST